MMLRKIEQTMIKTREKGKSRCYFSRNNRIRYMPKSV